MSAPDKNFLSYADRTDIAESGRVIDPRAEGLDPAMFDDLLKLSNVQRVHLTDFTIRGGGQKENGMDMNRNCADVVLERFTIVEGRENAITIKGGCHDITLRDIAIVPGAGHCDIELGNWSDQSDEEVKRVLLERITRTDGQPVRLRVVHAEMPVIAGGNVKFLRWESYALRAYWWAKWASRHWFGGRLAFLIK